MSIRRTSAIFFLVMIGATSANSASAATCSVNILDAYNLAKANGLRFDCQSGESKKTGIKAKFVVYTLGSAYFRVSGHNGRGAISAILI